VAFFQKFASGEMPTRLVRSPHPTAVDSGAVGPRRQTEFSNRADNKRWSEAGVL